MGKFVRYRKGQEQLAADSLSRTNKPVGEAGKNPLWYSPAETDDWREWCERKSWTPSGGYDFKELCEIDESNIITISEPNDLAKIRKYIKPLPKHEHSQKMPLDIDFVEMQKDGIDGLHVTNRYAIDDMFQAWDVDSLVILNEKAIKNCFIEKIDWGKLCPRHYEDEEVHLSEG
jgi:hypothetical protein